VNTLKLQLAQATNDTAMTIQAVDAIVATGQSPKSSLAALYNIQGQAAATESNFAKAEAAFGKVAEFHPEHPLVIMLLAEAKIGLGKRVEALHLINQAIALKQKAGEEVPETWLRASKELAASAGGSQ
jgi:Flp pilus assembly protein TadD